jgi:ABC-type Fe3+ transport system permease subunit
MSRKFWAFLALLIVLSPLFAFAAEIVGYSEPLENIAEKLGAQEKNIYEGILPDYSVPWLDMASGTLLSAVIGVLITMGVAFGIARSISRKHD